jgi:hypothetical protein
MFFSLAEVAGVAILAEVAEVAGVTVISLQGRAIAVVKHCPAMVSALSAGHCNHCKQCHHKPDFLTF